MGESGPVLELGEHAAAVNLPDKGCVLVDYEKDEDGNLQVRTVCLPGKGAARKPMDEPEDLAAALGNEVRAENEQGDDEDDDDEE